MPRRDGPQVLEHRIDTNDERAVLREWCRERTGTTAEIQNLFVVPWEYALKRFHEVFPVLEHPGEFEQDFLFSYFFLRLRFWNSAIVIPIAERPAVEDILR